MSSEVFARDHYEREDIARIYGQWKDLLPAEKVLLELYRERIQGQRVLDLGCGGGRTSPWLHPLASRYLGVDYSARMVEVCRARYPEFAFTQGNARDLAALANASFDFVLFSYNGIDTMPHPQRLEVLAAVRRVLRDDGWFAFSSHSIEFRNIVVALDLSALLTLGGLRRNLKYLRSYLRVCRHQVRTSEYAILSDPRGGTKQLHYFISRRNQIEQLRANGFVDIDILSWDGRRVSADEADSDSSAFYYICRKAAEPPLAQTAFG